MNANVMRALSTMSLTLVASALSKEYGIKVYMDADDGEVFTEYGDDYRPQAIHLSPVEVDDPNYLPKVRGYIDHEAGHARFTAAGVLDASNSPLLAWANGCGRIINNIFEDVFVERKMTQLFPGCGRNLRKMEELTFLNEDYLGLNVYSLGQPSLEPSNNYVYQLMATWTLFAARATRSPQMEETRDLLRGYMDSALPGLAEALTPVIETVCTTSKSSHDNMDGTDRYIKVVEQYIQTPPASQQAQQDGQDGQQNQQGQGQNQQQGGGGQGGQGGSGNQQSQGSEQSDQDGQDGQGGQSGQSGQSGQDGEQEAGEQPDGNQGKPKSGRKSLRQKQMHDALKRKDPRGVGGKSGFSEDNAAKYSVTAQVSSTMKEEAQTREKTGGGDGASGVHCIMKWHEHGRCETLRDDDIRQSMSVSRRLSAQLRGLLQAWSISRASGGLAGKLDKHQLHRLAVNNPRIFQRRSEKRKLDTEVVVLVDMSGSMCGAKEELTSQALYAVMTALRSLPGVQSGAYGFDDDTIYPVCPMGTKLTTQMHIRAGGGTSLGSAVAGVVSEFRGDKSRKVMIILSDGETFDTDYSKQIIGRLLSAGVTVAGVGIIDNSIKNIMPAKYCRIVHRLPELVPTLFGILKGALLDNRLVAR